MPVRSTNGKPAGPKSMIACSPRCVRTIPNRKACCFAVRNDEFVRMLGLHHTFTELQIAAAFEWALTAGCFTEEGVRHWLRTQYAPLGGPVPEEVVPPLARPTPRVAQPNLEQYLALVEAGGHDGN